MAGIEGGTGDPCGAADCNGTGLARRAAFSTTSNELNAMPRPAWLAGLGMALSPLLVVLNAARLAKPVPLQSAAPQGAPVPPSMPATA